MKFGALLAIITFCAGAAFTLVDIGSDSALAFEYWKSSDIVRGGNPLQMMENSKTGWINVGRFPGDGQVKSRVELIKDGRFTNLILTTQNIAAR